MRHSSMLSARALLLSLPALIPPALTLPALILLSGPARAQAPAPRPTFAQALAALEAPKQDLFLTVGADRIALPPGTPPPAPADRPGAVGAAYGRLARDFGGVTALAPPTMVTLNAHLGVPDPYDGMPPEDALKLLLAGLTPPQWAAITGEAGLGMADLSDEGQRGLFRAVLPSEDVMANPQATGGPLPASVPLTVQDLRAARLRLGRQTQMAIPVEGKPSLGSGSPPATPGGQTLYSVSVPDPPAGQDTAAFGAVLHQTLANNPKDADLDYNAPALKQSLRVDGLATVGDLVARVGQAAGLELYADRRYEKRPVTLLGRRTAREVDLLRAVAFCVTGTFRRVGPAYVLTDDLEGTATRRLRLARFMSEAEMKLSATLAAAADSLAAAPGLDALPALDSLGLSDAQRAQRETPTNQVYVAGSPVYVPFAALTPAQQEYAAGRVRQANAEADKADQSGGHADRLTLAGQFTLEAQPFLFLRSPAVPGPVELIGLTAHSFSLFQPSLAAMVRMEGRRVVEAARKRLPRIRLQPIPPPALAALLAPTPRRAVLVAPRTAAEVDAVVMEMKVLGLNQLWLDVFVAGRSRLDADKGGSDILTEALARTKGTGISVIPALDLLRWGVDAPAGALDLTALGENSAEQLAWQRHYDDVTVGRISHSPARTLPDDAWACPAAPAVEATLLALVRRLAATPGVTTLALRDTIPPTYDHPPDAGVSNSSDNSAQDLGFVPALRLALLRRDHVDPLDMGAGFDARPGQPDDDWNALGNPAKEWNTLRDGADRDLLQRLLAAAQEAGGRRFRFLVKQRGEPGDDGWYGMWEDPQAPLPQVPTATPRFGHPPPEPDYARIAHSQSRIALGALPPSATDPYFIAAAFQRLKPGWDGVLVDATNPWGVDSLARLASGVKR